MKPRKYVKPYNSYFKNLNMSSHGLNQGNSELLTKCSVNSRNFAIDALLGNINKSNELTHSEKYINKQSASSNYFSTVTETTYRQLNISKNLNDKIQDTGDVRLELCSRSLWTQFSCIGNEMIVNKTGRRIFPPLKVKITGLQPEKNYVIWVEIAAVSENRYRYQYQSCKWVKAGIGEPQDPQNKYIHPDSPATGRYWMTQIVSFDKLKLTNNKYPKLPNQVIVHSMHKYQPRFYILPVEDIVTNVEKQINPCKALKFEFKETTFITVTAYQNQNIIKLKIYHNPFAKGFREINRSKESNKSKYPMYQLYSSLHNFKPISKVLPNLSSQIFQRYLSQISAHRNFNNIPISTLQYQTFPVNHDIFPSYIPQHMKKYSFHPY
ncbi:T-box transcription factor TBX6-like isoform X1 [Centruroides sculpturatus]|uniref:T-box transcription factor TBX6-like isoform X1 n=2 Tax=Centruroides sculpturatus TaxID=218467 RepID=UPI000C6C9E8C|nr:T-box transcription factor TBX6-like isoform X1 [Centruroides sculpturatus]